MLRSLTISNVGETLLTLAEAKQYLKIYHDDDDSEILQLLAEAYGKAEARTGRQLRTASAVLTLDRFPPNGQPIVLPRPPLVSVESVNYFNAANESQSLTGFQLGSALVPGIIALPTTSTRWPDTKERIDAVTVTYSCGGVEPEQVRSAVRLMLDLDYNAIEGQRADQINRRIDALLHGYIIRDPRLYGVTT